MAIAYLGWKSKTIPSWKIIAYAITTSDKIDLEAFNSTKTADVMADTTISLAAALTLLCIEGFVASCIHSKVLIYSVSVNIYWH